jgi:hypothetical protein
VPVPPIQLALITLFADNCTGLLPQTAWLGPALEVAGMFTLRVIGSDAAVQGPAPSGSGTFHVKVTEVPFSEMAGV